MHPLRFLRQILFWSHLAAGLVAGVFIGIMCFTGAVLAFEHEIVEWSERDARRVVVPIGLSSEASAKEGAPRLPLADLQRRLREAEPEFRPASVTLLNDATAAIIFTAGRDDNRFVNPYTGEVRRPASTRVHDFMHVMTDWHRYLAREGDSRATGKLVNGICNLAFCALALTGLCLWWPRTLTWRSVRAVALFNWRLAGKARDFNWHNAIGLWTAPILVVLTLTAVPISFRWGGDLIYRLVGEEPPAQGANPGPPAGAPSVTIERPSPEARPLAQDAILASVTKDFPTWKQITLRTGGPPRGARGAASANVGEAPSRRETPVAVTEPRRELTAHSPADAGSTPIENRESKIENPPARPVRAEGERPRADSAVRNPQSAIFPLTVTVRESGSWPRTATTTLMLNPFTGEMLSRSGYADLSAARQIRSWTRFLHTGQALGWAGQLVAGLACLGGCFLVYTGFALSWRRFFCRKAAEGAVPDHARGMRP